MAHKEETIKIEGMSCGHCVKAVRSALEALAGVDVHAVEIGTAQVGYDTEATDAAQIVEAIEDAGYTVLETV